MKIIHTSDWHLGQRFKNYDRDEEHKYFIEQLCKIMAEEKPDALVVSGDIYNVSAPAAQTQKDFVDYVLDLRKASPSTSIFITAGNHDSGYRLEVEKKLWFYNNVIVTGFCERKDDGTFDPSEYVREVKGKDGDVRGYVITVPYINDSYYPLTVPGLAPDKRQQEFFKALEDAAAKKNKDGLPVVMMAHLSVRGCDTTGHEEKPIGKLETQDLGELGTGYDYLALGHIHKPQTLKKGTLCARYSGSPIPLSFTEDFEHSVTVVEIEKFGSGPNLRTIPLDVLRKVKTIPEKAADLESALDALSNVDEKDNSYIRLNVKAEGNVLPADAEDRANLKAKGKACRYCEIHLELPKTSKASEEDSEGLAIDEIQAKSPMEIAKETYSRKYNGEEMSKDLSDLMLKAIEEVNNEKRQ